MLEAGCRRVALGRVATRAAPQSFKKRVCLCSGDPRLRNDLLKPLRVSLKPQEDDVRVMSYLEAQGAALRPAPFAHFETNLFLPELSAAAVGAITTAINDAPPQFRVLIVPFFGAITRVATSDTAFALRQPGYAVDLAANWNVPAEKANAVQWVKTLRDKLQPLRMERTSTS